MKMAFSAVALVLFCCGSAVAQTSAYRINTLTAALSSPAALAFLPDGSMLVAQRGGALRLMDAQGVLQPETVQGIPGDGLDDTTGLIDIALDPDFPSTRRIFLSYQRGTLRANHMRLVSGQLKGDANRLELVNVKTVFDAQPAKRGASNFGGRIAFLADKTLVMSVGDGFDGREQAQRIGNHFGKLVRLDRDGSALPDNPFAGLAGAAPEVYSMGHRNVQGLAFDAISQRLYANDHGAKGGDEINIIEPGGNYGWPLTTHGKDYIGARVTPYTSLPGLIAPLLHWTPSIAPSSIAVYRGKPFQQWNGDLLNSSLVGKGVYRVRLVNQQPVQQEKLFSELDSRIRQVSVGPDGLIYLLTDEKKNARLLRVEPVS